MHILESLIGESCPVGNLLPSNVHDGHIRVLKQGMDTEHGVVRLDHCSCHLWARPNCEGNLALFAVVHRQALQHQAAQAGSRAAANRVVHAEALQAGAVIGELPDSSAAKYCTRTGHANVQ